jgi:hypothetical protein
MSDKTQREVKLEEKIQMLEARIQSLEGRLKIAEGVTQDASADSYQFAFHLKRIIDSMGPDSPFDVAVRNAREFLENRKKS